MESEVGKGSTFTLYLPIEWPSDTKNLDVSKVHTLHPEKKELNAILNSLKLTDEGVETAKMDNVDELLNEAGDDRARTILDAAQADCVRTEGVVG